jgi:dihydropteroate synthase
VSSGVMDQAGSRAREQWSCRARVLGLDRPRLLGIVNITPDSFSDGGVFFSPDAAVAHAERLLAAGADILDLGAESTRPQGARPVEAGEELRRLLPVLRAIRIGFPGTFISVDTVKAEVAAAALDEGADIINDVSGFRLDEKIGEVCARAGAGVILMHSRGSVNDMATYEHAVYGPDPVGEIITELGECISAARNAGVSNEAIVVDPGVGFSKRTAHSRAVLAGLDRFSGLGHALCVGVSRKRIVGELAGGIADPLKRESGTVALNVLALQHGARLFRVHDVAASRQALDVAWSVLTAGEN